jgi:vacuolar protein sorting-associated protein 72
VDSDFSIDENDEARSDLENDDDNEPRRKIRRAAGVQTKAYKEPARRDQAGGRPPKVATNKSVPRPQKSAVARLATTSAAAPTSDYYTRRPTMRASTAQKTSEIIRTLKARDAEAKRRRLRIKKQGQRGEERRLTQAELLAEARLTEKANLESLRRYEEMELEAKRRAVRTGKREIRGPAIRYHSVR